VGADILHWRADKTLALTRGIRSEIGEDPVSGIRISLNMGISPTSCATPDLNSVQRLS